MGTAAAKRTESQRGQALLVALFALILGAAVLFSFASALAGKGRAQRAADLAALSSARSMKDDLERLFEPATIDGRPNPYHLSEAHYLARARAAALTIGRANGARLQPADVTFHTGLVVGRRARRQPRPWFTVGRNRVVAEETGRGREVDPEHDRVAVGDRDGRAELRALADVLLAVEAGLLHDGGGILAGLVDALVERVEVDLVHVVLLDAKPAPKA